MPEVNISRRVKRHIWAPEHELALVVKPGLEELAVQELVGLGMREVVAQQGVVVFRARLEGLYRVLLMSRVGGRVLLRLKRVRLRAWRDAVQAAEAVAWECICPPGGRVRVEVVVRSGRLAHPRHMAELVEKAIVQRMRAVGLEPPVSGAGREEAELVVILRVEGHHATLSVDTTGPHMHKRGYRLEPGPAPLREDLAAALLKLADYEGQWPVLEGMCGAGTIAIEAAMMARGLPPGAERSFAIHRWPCHRPRMWDHLRTKALESALEAPPKPIIARDRDPEAIEIAIANAARAGLVGQLRFSQADFFTAPPPFQPPALVVLDPPYGPRLASASRARALAERIGRRLKQAYQGWRCAVVVPEIEWVELMGLSRQKTLVVPHGGRRVVLAAGWVD